MSPNSIGSEERNVGNVTHAVAGISDQLLARRLCPPGAGSTYHASYRRSARGTTARSAAAARVIQEICFSCGAVAEAASSVSLAEAFELRDQQAGAGIVPWNLWNIRLGRSEC